MAYKIAINGYGRIGRNILRSIYEYGYRDSIEIAAINDIADKSLMAYLTRNDTLYGRFPLNVNLDGSFLNIGDDSIRLFSEQKAENLPWKDMGIDIVLECTGICNTRPEINAHLLAGAPRVLLSYPGPADVDRTVVYGVNHKQLSPDDIIVSNASCTSNCLVPVLKIIDDSLGIEAGAITSIHSMMNDQPVLDTYWKSDVRKTRSAVTSIVPVETRLAHGVSRVIPHLDGLLEATAVRIPVVDVSALDINLFVKRETTADEVNRLIESASADEFRDIVGCSTEPLVSCDFRRDKRSAIIDASQTRVGNKRLVKLFAWFDNEWAYAVRMCDTSLFMLNLKK